MNGSAARNNTEGMPQRQVRYWRFYPGHQAQAWQYFSDSGIIGMGPRPGSNDQEPDLRTMAVSSFEDFRSDLLSVKKWDPQSPHPRRLWHFLHDMAPGDKVVAYGQAQVLGLGEITGEYYYEEDEHGYPHRRSVQWTNTEPVSSRSLASDLQNKLMARTPIVSLSLGEYEQIGKLMGNQGQRTWIFQAKPEDYDLKQELRRRIGDSWDLRSFSNRAHELQVGDRVLLWRSRDPKAKEVGGVYGTGRVACRAYPLDNGRQGVDLVYQSILVTPLLRDELKEDSELSAMAIMKQAAGTVFPVTLEQWDRLASLLGELVPAGSQVQVWWVNQGGSYKQERDEGILFAGLQEGGVVSEARRRLEDMLPGDLVLSYVDKKVVAVSRVQGKWQRRESKAHDGEVGRVVPLEYHEFEEPIPVTNETLTAIRELAIEGGPVSLSGALTVLQGYCWRFNAHGLVILYISTSEAGWPSWPELDAVIDGGGAMQIRLLPTVREALKRRSLHFTDWQIATFYTALQTKGFVILSGISGTGKTQLARVFAELLPQPATSPAVQEGVIAITARPYMLKYNRFIVPKSAVALFTPPAAGKSQEVRVEFEDQSQECQFDHTVSGNTDYLCLLLRGKAREWFKANVAEGQVFYLDPAIDEQDALTGFRLSTEVAGVSSVESEAHGDNHLFVSVRPDWRDSKSLLGYYNPLTGSYEWTPFLRFLLRARESYQAADGQAWFVILDEMNLAHVEYYFADLLSVLESGRDKDDRLTKEPLRLPYPDDAEGDLPPQELRLPPNLYVVGTVNVDETTHAFSPKVLDRAFTLRFSDADFAGYPPADGEMEALAPEEQKALLTSFTRGDFFARIDKAAIREYVEAHPGIRSLLQPLAEALAPYELHFAYRVFDEIVCFMDWAEYNGCFEDMAPGSLTHGSPEDAALDAAILMKVLPKFNGSRRKLEKPLQVVLAWCINPESPTEAAPQIRERVQKLEQGEDGAGNVLVLVGPGSSGIAYRFPHTAERAARMLQALYDEGFAAFG